MGNYSRGDEASLPSGVADLETLYDGTDQAAVVTAGDSQFATQTATAPQIPIHQYKDTVTAPTVDLTWTGQSDQDCADYPVTLQVYKFSTTTWETLATNNTTTANTNFTLQKLGQASSGYVDGSNVLTSRVYQAASGATPSLITSYTEANYGPNDTKVYSDGSGEPESQEGQSFMGDGKTITSVKFYLKKLGNPSGNVTAYFWDHTGTFGDGGKPTGSAKSTSATKNILTDITTSYQLIEFEFTTGSRSTVVDTPYCVTVEYTGGDIDNCLMIGSGWGGAAGNTVYYNWSTWTGKNTLVDTIFYVYGV